MTTTTSAQQWPTTLEEIDLQDLTESRDRGVRWLTERVGADGAPEGADRANAWWRAPWALAVGGAPDVASAMLGWIERTALTSDGDLREGPASAPAPGSPVYHLSPIAIAAWLLGRYDTAEAVNTAMARYQDPDSGGVYEYATFDDPLQDMLKTAQLGVSALVTRDRNTADGVYSWLQETYALQQELPTRLYTSRRHGTLVTAFEPNEAFGRVVDFTAERQAYFQPGIAAAFLAGYSQQTGLRSPMDLAHSYLALNLNGTEQQFNDASSVQICKFGWGAAVAQAVSPNPDTLASVVKMAAWFMRNQRPDGSWAPSSFVRPEPTLLDLYWKTAEHVMEVSYILNTLRAEPGQRPTSL
ncbi:hypothetical protein [Arthrobacter sp. SAFR-044]|uniref:hypothetical protein n=1 Tax=Arthrobacter sp. SAFR-044 TaxID=3387278 RepID=UPI003F7C5EDA